MKPNEERKIPDGTQDPPAVREVAKELLGEVSFATALFEPATAVSLSRVPTDAELWKFDEEVSRALFAQHAAARVSISRSILAPILRKVARTRVRELMLSVVPESRDATRNRAEIAASWNLQPLDWSSEDTWELSPLEIALSSTQEPGVVLLTPDQYRACGIIEVVRAAGRVLGSCDGDSLADDFMRLIIAASDEDESVVSAVAGGFVDHAREETRAVGKKLDGPSQLLAVTILASWIRMSRLGVRLSSLDRLALWGEFFDGQVYGARTDLIGEAWDLSDEEQRATADRMDLKGDKGYKIPWMEAPGGVPLVFVGIAAELLRLAINRCGILDQVSEGFSVSDPMDTGQWEIPSAPGHVNTQADRILVQLRDRHNYLVGQPIAKCRKLRLLKNLDSDLD